MHLYLTICGNIFTYVLSLINVGTIIAAAIVASDNSWHLLRAYKLPDTVQVFYMY